MTAWTRTLEGLGQERPCGRSWFCHGPSEFVGVMVFTTYAFLLLVCYYVLKTLREPLLLAESSAEVKSYAYATIAAIIIVMLPIYGALYRRIGGQRLIRAVTAFFAANLGIFLLLGWAGVNIGFAYYVWVGIFGVTLIAQFWAHAADAYDVASGQRTFPIIMIGATLGGLVGPPLAGFVFAEAGPWLLMLIVMAILTATIPLIDVTRRSVYRDKRDRECSPLCHTDLHRSSGVSYVFRDEYLFLVALLVVLLNCVNSLGEFILTDFVVRNAEAEAAGGSTLTRGEIIAVFYSNFYLAVNGLTLIFQVFLVSRLFRWIGVRSALLIVPVIALIGYGVAGFIPVFSIVQILKILENSADYSIMNTARQALFLPLSTTAKYQGKTIIDTFFWRLGDVLQAGFIYAGLNWFGFEAQQFALINVVLACFWIGVAASLGRRYAQTGRSNSGAMQVMRHMASASHSVAFGPTIRRGAPATFAAVIVGLAVSASSPVVARERAELFSSNEPLAIDFYVDKRALCRGSEREYCVDAPAQLVYRNGSEPPRSFDVRVRVRGRKNALTAGCSLPALFVFFVGPTERTIFEGHEALPLTTHCRKSASYEQYILKEYLAYRIYNILTDNSLRIRLARITYHDTASRRKPIERYGFFTEHFETFADRHLAEVWHPERLDVAQVDPIEMATLDLFQYMIGNTDWSAVYRHNVFVIRTQDGAVTPVAYDFDFSGLVDATYAGPPPKLPIRNVRQRLYRGFCRSDLDWEQLYESFLAKEQDINSLVAEVPGLLSPTITEASSYLDSFFVRLHRHPQTITSSCRTSFAKTE